MAADRARGHDPPRMDEHPPSGLGTEPARASGGRGAPLRRRVHDRVIAGVCGGLADHFGISVLGLRIVFGFAALVVGFLLVRPFVDPGLGSYVYRSSDLASLRALVKLGSGLGVIAYLGLWIFVPSEDADASTVRRVARRLPRPSGLLDWVGMLAFVAGASLFGALLGLWTPDVTWAFLLIGVGVLLFRRDAERRHATPTSGEAEAPASPPSLAAMTTASPPEPAPIERRPRERSPLGWLTLGIALLVVGGAAILQNLGALHLRPVRFPALFVLILGIGMLVGSLVGRARWVLLPALVVAPVMLLFSLIQVPLVGGFQGLNAYVRSADQVRPAYRAVAGDVWVDLTALACTSDRLVVHGSTGVGSIGLYVPVDSRVIAYASTGLGTVSLGSHQTNGAGVADRATLEPSGGTGPTIVADLEAGLGNVNIYREAMAKKQRARTCR
jgi:phage shock protein PspC (stress-responsive transcriptional regulator)